VTFMIVCILFELNEKKSLVHLVLLLFGCFPHILDLHDIVRFFLVALVF
jgi:hypothetical protein